MHDQSDQSDCPPGQYVFTGKGKGVVQGPESLPGYQQHQRYWSSRCRGAVVAPSQRPFFGLGTGEPRNRRRLAWRRLRATANAQRSIQNDGTYRASGMLSLVDIVELREAGSPQGNVNYVRHPDHVPHAASTQWWRAMWTHAEVSP